MKGFSNLLAALRSLRSGRDGPNAGGLPEEWLFTAAAAAVIIVDAESGRIVEANAAAAALVAVPRAELIGTPLARAFPAAGEPELRQLEEAARASGRSGPATLLHPAGEVAVSLSLVRASGQVYFLVHLAPAVQAGAEAETFRGSSIVLEVIADAADGFLVTDLGLRIAYANRAFASLAGVGSPADLFGKSLSRWIGFGQEDLTLLKEQMAGREAARVLSTTLRARRQPPRPIEVTAIAVPDEHEPCFGFCVRALGTA